VNEKWWGGNPGREKKKKKGGEVERLDRIVSFAVVGHKVTMVMERPKK